MQVHQSQNHSYQSQPFFCSCRDVNLSFHHHTLSQDFDSKINSHTLVLKSYWELYGIRRPKPKVSINENRSLSVRGLTKGLAIASLPRLGKEASARRLRDLLHAKLGREIRLGMRCVSAWARFPRETNCRMRSVVCLEICQWDAKSYRESYWIQFSTISLVKLHVLSVK